MIMNKWSNIRDSFLRSLRTNSGQGAKKSYIYGEHLNFLLKIVQKDNTEANYSQLNTSHDNNDVNEESLEPQLATGSDPQPHKPTPSETPAPSNSMQPVRKTKKSNRDLDFIEREILTELKKAKQSNELPESPPRTELEILLLSFLPYLRDMSESELMDLQMETLTTIKKIKQNRSFNQHIITSPSTLQQHSDVSPMTSPAIINSDSHQSFTYQSPPLSIQKTHEQELSPKHAILPLTSVEHSTSSFAYTRSTPSNEMILQHIEQEPSNYTVINKYQQLFDQADK